MRDTGLDDWPPPPAMTWAERRAQHYHTTFVKPLQPKVPTWEAVDDWRRMQSLAGRGEAAWAAVDTLAGRYRVYGPVQTPWARFAKMTWAHTPESVVKALDALLPEELTA